ncbi:MAG: hypothetical protein ACJAT6_001714, partial [Akkermansiaceae bacterium]
WLVVSVTSGVIGAAIFILIFAIDCISGSSGTSDGGRFGDVASVASDNCANGGPSGGTTQAILLLGLSAGNESESSGSQACRNNLSGFHVILKRMVA